MQFLSQSIAAQRCRVAVYGGIQTRVPFLRTMSAHHSRGATTASTNSKLEVVRVPALSDNYIWLVREPASGLVAVVDPSEAAPVNTVLQQKGWSLKYIINTHHHFDHTGGNLELKKQHGLQVVGPRADADRIPGIDVQVGDGDTWKFGELEATVFDTPGHTRGHITFYFPQAKAVFPGDTLFALGCGKTFEGDPQTMWSSLSKFLPLPGDTAVYCAHEYTQSNAKFAVHIDPNNQALQQRKKKIDEFRSRGEPTVPSWLGEEFDTNPFLRPKDSAIRSSVQATDNEPDWEVFGRVRAAKDNFRG